MRLAHKRKVQLKLRKQMKATVVNLVVTEKTVKSVVEKKAPLKAAAEKAIANTVTGDIDLTPKQQQVLAIIAENADGINPKGIGLAAGQDDGKAAAWATGALKKLLDENLVIKEQVGNKVSYKMK